MHRHSSAAADPRAADREGFIVTKSKSTRGGGFGAGGMIALMVVMMTLVACTQTLLPAPPPSSVQVNGHVVERNAQGAPTGRVEFGVSAFTADGGIVERATIRSVRATLTPTSQGVEVAAIVVNGRVCGDIAPGSGSLAAVLMLDESRSMASTDPTKLRHLAGRRFIEAMPTRDAVAVGRFPARSTSTARLRDSSLMADFGVDRPASIAGVLASPHAYGMRTPLWTAAEDAVTLLSARREPNRVAVILTDGANTTYTGSAARANAYAKLHGVRLFAVGFGDARARELDALVAGTGGYRNLMNPTDPNQTIGNLLDDA